MELSCNKGKAANSTPESPSVMLPHSIHCTFRLLTSEESKLMNNGLSAMASVVIPAVIN